MCVRERERARKSIFPAGGIDRKYSNEVNSCSGRGNAHLDFSGKGEIYSDGAVKSQLAVSRNDDIDESRQKFDMGINPRDTKRRHHHLRSRRNFKSASVRANNRFARSRITRNVITCRRKTATSSLFMCSLLPTHSPPRVKTHV